MMENPIWKKSHNKWQRYIPEMDVMFNINIQPAGYDYGRRYVLDITYDGRQIKDFHKFYNDGSNLAKY